MAGLDIFKRQIVKPTRSEIEMVGASTPNLKHPHRNEDTYFTGERSFGVFDGVSGESGNDGGDIAAAFASNHVRHEFQKLDSLRTIDEIRRRIAQIFIEAHQLIQTLQETTLFGQKHPLMETTATAVYIAELKGIFGRRIRRAVIGHVGDSRIYTSSDKGLEQTTIDDGPVGALLETGDIDEHEAREMQSLFNNCADPNDFTQEELKLWKFRNRIFQALGSNNNGKNTLITPRTYVVDLPYNKPNGHTLLAVTDGISDPSTDNDILHDITQGEGVHDIKSAINRLIKNACSRGINPNNFRRKPFDDRTAVLAHVQ